MLIRLGYDIGFSLSAPTAMTALLHVHPCRAADLRQPDLMSAAPVEKFSMFEDCFGNRCTRFLAIGNSLSITGSAVIESAESPDPIGLDAAQLPVEDLPNEALQFLLSSRYCEVDSMSSIALDLFSHTPPGWERVAAICDWVNARVRFGYHHARATRTALEVFVERVGVCRDFQHLAVTLCRAMNIPARYATGYLGDIGVPPSTNPMDFSAWFEVYLGDRWWTFDARHRMPRIGRVLMAVGRDAADVALTTSFGQTTLQRFEVVTEVIAGI
jgi:transglutaminase-like putative cysteine protease